MSHVSDSFRYFLNKNIFDENADYMIETSGEFVLDKGTEIELGATLVVTPSDINY